VGCRGAFATPIADELAFEVTDDRVSVVLVQFACGDSADLGAEAAGRGFDSGFDRRSVKVDR